MEPLGPGLGHRVGGVVARRHRDDAKRDAHLLGIADHLVVRALRREAAGLVRVEGQNDVLREALERAQVLEAEGRPARRHGRLDPGLVQRDHVGVALDDQAATRLHDLALRAVQRVEHLGLLVDRALGRVQVLRPVLVAHLARAERDRAAGQVLDREHHAPAEAVDQAAVLTARAQPRVGDLLLGEPFPLEVGNQRVPLREREADLELLERLFRKTALLQEVRARVGRFRRALQRLVVISRGFAVRIHEARAAAMGCAVGVGKLLVMEIDAGHLREPLNRFHERQVLDLLDEPDRVAALAAAEAVPQAFGGIQGERRRLLRVEWAQRLVEAPRTLHLHVFRGDLDQVRAPADLFEVGVADASGRPHFGSSRKSLNA